jgi:hypothetical protein
MIRFFGTVSVPAFALALAGCQETAPVASPRVDAPGVPVSVQSISGAPDSVTASFAGLLGEAAADRKMEIVPGDKPARFRVRGYLTAQPTADGQTALAFVWDVYDAKRQLAQRVQGESLGKRAGGGDPWAGIDQSVVAAAASESMSRIAGFLAAQPRDEPKAAGAGPAQARGGARPAARAQTADASAAEKRL